MNENLLSNKVIGLAIEVHRALGPGLLESAYEECLYYKIVKSDLHAQKQKAMPLIFEEASRMRLSDRHFGRRLARRRNKEL